MTQREATVTNALKANIATDGIYFTRYAEVSWRFGPKLVLDWSEHSYSIRREFAPFEAISATDTTFVGGVYPWVGSIDIAAYCRAGHAADRPLRYRDFGTGFIRFFVGNMAAGQTKTYSVTYRAH